METGTGLPLDTFKNMGQTTFLPLMLRASPKQDALHTVEREGDQFFFSLVHNVEDATKISLITA